MRQSYKLVVNDWKDKYLRLAAEFDNYKKRNEKERQSTYDYAIIEAAEKFLQMADSLESAKKMNVEGINPILNQFKTCLENLGISEIPIEKFDPNFHNAVMHVEDENYEENQIVEEFAKGYKLGDKVIRHSMVKVAN